MLLLLNPNSEALGRTQQSLRGAIYRWNSCTLAIAPQQGNRFFCGPSSTFDKPEISDKPLTCLVNNDITACLLLFSLFIF